MLDVFFLGGGSFDEGFPEVGVVEPMNVLGWGDWRDEHDEAPTIIGGMDSCLCAPEEIDEVPRPKKPLAFLRESVGCGE